MSQVNTQQMGRFIAAGSTPADPLRASSPGACFGVVLVLEFRPGSVPMLTSTRSGLAWVTVRARLRMRLRMRLRLRLRLRVGEASTRSGLA